jgi:hypothetical protein
MDRCEFPQGEAMPRSRGRLTVRHLMLVVCIIGVAIGGSIGIERASVRRADYLGLAAHADRVEQSCRRIGNNSISQAAAIRHWVATGAQGTPPGGPGDPDANAQPEKLAFTFGPEETDAFRSNPELALALAARLEQQAPRLHKRAADLARRRTRFERCASYPWVFFAADAPSAKQDAKEAGY